MAQSRNFGPLVDYVKSIATERLVYRKKTRYDYLLMRFLFIVVIAVCIGGVIVNIYSGALGGAFILLMIAAYLTPNLYYQNKLVKVKGVGLLQNKEDVKQTLRLFYDDLTFNLSSDNIIRDVSFGGYFFEPTWDIIVLLKEDVVYFHRSDMGKWNVISPLFGVSNYYKCQKIAARFQNIQQNQQSEIPS